jgi:hypothetical protein
VDVVASFPADPQGGAEVVEPGDGAFDHPAEDPRLTTSTGAWSGPGTSPRYSPNGARNTAGRTGSRTTPAGPVPADGHPPA